jgi:hypothetical protein
LWKSCPQSPSHAQSGDEMAAPHGVAGLPAQDPTSTPAALHLAAARREGTGWCKAGRYRISANIGEYRRISQNIARYRGDDITKTSGYTGILQNQTEDCH